MSKQNLLTKDETRRRAVALAVGTIADWAVAVDTALKRRVREANALDVQRITAPSEVFAAIVLRDDFKPFVETYAVDAALRESIRHHFDV